MQFDNLQKFNNESANKYYLLNKPKRNVLLLSFSDLIILKKKLVITIEYVN